MNKNEISFPTAFQTSVFRIYDPEEQDLDPKMTSKSEPGGYLRELQKPTLSKNLKNSKAITICYVLAMSACPKIINFGTQKPPKIDQKMLLEK